MQQIRQTSENFRSDRAGHHRDNHCPQTLRGDRCGVRIANQCSGAISRQCGFTLLELLVIVSILAAIAFVTTGTFQGVGEAANDNLVRSEMQEIAKAIRQFKQDTGYYPKQGPFDLDTATGQVPIGTLPVHAGSNNTEKQRWFYSPANFHQLFVNPLAGTGHLLESWDIDSGRGWRGPYLKGFAEGFVDIRDDINPAVNGAGGDPLDGDNIPDVEGLADPFEHRTVPVDGNSLLDWSATAGGDEREVWGRPYLLFGLGASPWLVSMGPDGVYGTSDDIELDLE